MCRSGKQRRTPNEVRSEGQRSPSASTLENTTPRHVSDRVASVGDVDLRSDSASEWAHVFPAEASARVQRVRQMWGQVSRMIDVSSPLPVSLWDPEFDVSQILDSTMVSAAEDKPS